MRRARAEHRRRLLAAGLIAWACAGSVQAMPAAAEDQPAATVPAEAAVELYFFWSENCPHCLNARPFVQALGARHGWLTVHDLEVTANPANARLYVSLARSLGQEAHSVPAFVFCGELVAGFDSPAGVGAYLERRLQQCRDAVAAGRPAAAPAPAALPVPVLGEVDLAAWSLPVLAVTLGALDSFNPCAFFVLLFLLTLLVHARSRRRMLLVGALFVTVSGFVYFLFMAAWLNLFILTGRINWITLAAGIVAILIGLLNVKDYLAFQRGVSLAIPASAKPALFARMRRLVSAERPATLIAGTLALAIAANAYELLCTAGFPMVFTRALTLHELPTGTYYLYLALYAAVYVVPMLVIVVLFVVSLGRRRLTEQEGRTLKLLSGLMMLGLGVTLVVAPYLLGNVLVAVGLLTAALALTLAARRWAPAGTR